MSSGHQRFRRVVAACLPESTKRIIRSLRQKEPRRWASSLGWPVFEPVRAGAVSTVEPSAGALPEVQARDVERESRAGTALVAVCTMNHLCAARTLVHSLRRHHAQAEMAIYLLVVDWDGREPLDVPDVQLLGGAGHRDRAVRLHGPEVHGGRAVLCL